MSLQAAIILIVLSAIGGYLVGILDSKFTNKLLSVWQKKKQERETPFIHVMHETKGKFTYYLQGKMIQEGDQIPPIVAKDLIKAVDGFRDLIPSPVADKVVEADKTRKGLRVSRITAPTSESKKIPASINSRIENPLPKTKQPKTLVDILNDQIKIQTEKEGLEVFARVETLSDDSIVYRVLGETYTDPEKIKDDRVRAIVLKILNEWKK